jgi:YfiH family protein
MYFSSKLNKFKKTRHYFFTRNNGFSTGVYKSLNCGKGSSDKKKNISKNLEFVSSKMKVDKKNLILMNQTHGNKVIIIDKKNKHIRKFKSDAIITKLKGLALGVLTADCVPIILYDKKNDIIGCVHAGWKGCIKNIIEHTINKFRTISKNSDIFACVGPCIGSESYEVDKKFLEIFLNNSKKNSLFFKSKGNKKLLFDIRGFVNNELLEKGVNDIDNIDMDTFEDPGNFFSYRRSRKLKESDYGRCISTICLKT